MSRPTLEPLAQSVLAEALRNIAKHADPDARRGRGRRATQDTFTLEVRNDGVARGRRRSRDGAAAGRVRGAPARAAWSSSGRRRRGLWRVRLVVPLQQEARDADALGRAIPLDDRRLRVLVVDDHDVVHWGFRVLLGEQPWVERCLAARTGAEALELARTFKPHVALVDLFLAGESGADVCESIREASPATRVLLISGAGRMSPAAARAAGRVGVRLQGLGGQRGRGGGAHGRARDDDVRRRRPSSRRRC